MKYVILTIPHSTFPECTQTNTHKCILSAQYQYILACRCCVLPSLLYSLLSEKKKKLQHILPAGSLSDYLTALGLAWQPAKGGWGRRRDERGRRREELVRDEVLRSTRVCDCVCLNFCVLCVWAGVCICLWIGYFKSINVRKFTKNIPEPILECQIRFLVVHMQVLLQCCDSESGYMDQSLTCWILFFPTSSQTPSPPPPL